MEDNDNRGAAKLEKKWRVQVEEVICIQASRDQEQAHEGEIGNNSSIVFGIGSYI